jgi:hypothetical protein
MTPSLGTIGGFGAEDEEEGSSEELGFGSSESE